MIGRARDRTNKREREIVTDGAREDCLEKDNYRKREPEKSAFKRKRAREQCLR